MHVICLHRSLDLKSPKSHENLMKLEIDSVFHSRGLQQIGSYKV